MMALGIALRRLVGRLSSLSHKAPNETCASGDDLSSASGKGRGTSDRRRTCSVSALHNPVAVTATEITPVGDSSKSPLPSRHPLALFSLEVSADSSLASTNNVPWPSITPLKMSATVAQQRLSGVQNMPVDDSTNPVMGDLSKLSLSSPGSESQPVDSPAPSSSEKRLSKSNRESLSATSGSLPVIPAEDSTTGGESSTPTTWTPSTKAMQLPRSRVSGISISSSRPAPPSPSASRHQSLSAPLNGFSTSPSSRPVSTVLSTKSRLSGLLDFPPSPNSINSPTTLATSSSPGQTSSRRDSNARQSVSSRRRSKRRSQSQTPTPTVKPAPPVVLIRDFAYPRNDDRHAGTITMTAGSASSSRRSSGFGSGWSGFAARFGWGSRNSSSSRLSKDNSNNQNSSAHMINYSAINASAEAATPTQLRMANRDADDDESDDDDGEEDTESPAYDYYGDDLGSSAPSESEQTPLVPGIYRAVYAFVAEGSAEMDLAEDQLVTVLGRGGGDGWVVVVSPSGGIGSEGGGQALVPESYLEFCSPLPASYDNNAEHGESGDVDGANDLPVHDEVDEEHERSSTPRA